MLKLPHTQIRVNVLYFLNLNLRKFPLCYSRYLNNKFYVSVLITSQFTFTHNLHLKLTSTGSIFIIRKDDLHSLETLLSFEKSNTKLGILFSQVKYVI